MSEDKELKQAIEVIIDRLSKKWKGMNIQQYPNVVKFKSETLQNIFKTPSRKPDSPFNIMHDAEKEGRIAGIKSELGGFGKGLYPHNYDEFVDSMLYDFILLNYNMKSAYDMYKDMEALQLIKSLLAGE